VAAIEAVSAGMAPTSSVVPMDNVGPYLHWGIVQISVANLTVILLMIAVFVVALFLRFPGDKS
jgi:hypothetical protein